MTTPAGAPGGPRLLQVLPPRLRRAVDAPTRGVTRLRRHPPPEQASLVALALLSVALLAGTVAYGIRAFPLSAQVVPLLLGGLLLRRRALRLLTLVVLAGLVFDALRRGFDGFPVGAVPVIAVTGLVAYEFARSQEETGLVGLGGETVLVELRRRLELQGTLPALPRGWRADSAVLPAGGVPFAGDFVVSALVGDRCEVAVVDVSGKGVEAGTRALLLSGALGGLLGGGDPGRFLAVANDYLVRQEWTEGFATAVHVAIDTRTGDFAVGSAGHPPVALFDAGTGRWSLLEATGLVLGLLPGVEYDVVRGRLDRGDALLLYTDGLVEVPGRDLAYGIDKLVGEAERSVAQGFRGGARALVERVAGTSPDDRGLVLLWRDA